MRIERDVAIEMDDGAVLRADVFRPAGEGRHPVILSYGPYAKGLAFQEGYPDQWERMVAAPPRRRGRLLEPASELGGGRSGEVGAGRLRLRAGGLARGGLLARPARPVLAARDERPGGVHRVGRLAAWSSGKVGLNGISYYAMNQWHVASRRPRGLAAMCAWEGASDWYRDATHHGGILCTFFGNWYEMQVATVQYGLGERGPVNPVTGEPVCGHETLGDGELAEQRADFAADVAAHPLDDGYHRERSGDWERLDVPLLSAGNWGGQGLHLRGNIEGYVRSASTRKWLELHGLEHWTHFYTDYGLRLQKRFFGHFLKGEDTGWEEQPRVLLQVRHVDGTFTERGEDEWPIARTEWTRLYLDAAERSLTPTPGQAASVSYEALGEGVTFAGPPLERALELTGPSAAKLFVASSTADADLFLVLRVFDPDGEEVTFQGAIDPHTPVGQGWLRASHRKLDPALSSTLPALPRARRAAAAAAGRELRARRRDLAHVGGRAAPLPHRAQRSRARLRAGRWRRRRAAVDLPQRAARIRPLPARRPRRPSG